MDSNYQRLKIVNTLLGCQLKYNVGCIETSGKYFSFFSHLD